MDWFQNYYLEQKSLSHYIKKLFYRRKDQNRLFHCDQNKTAGLTLLFSYSFQIWGFTSVLGIKKIQTFKSSLYMYCRSWGRSKERLFILSLFLLIYKLVVTSSFYFLLFSLYRLDILAMHFAFSLTENCSVGKPITPDKGTGLFTERKVFSL